MSEDNNLLVVGNNPNPQKKFAIEIATMRERYALILQFARKPMTSDLSPAEILGLDIPTMQKEVNVGISRMERNLCTTCAVTVFGKPNKFTCLRCETKVSYTVCYDDSGHFVSGEKCPITESHTHFGCKCGDIVVPGVVRYSQTRVS